MRSSLNHLGVVRKGVIVPTIGQLFCFGVDGDKTSAPHGTRRDRDVGPATFIEEEVPDANASGPVATHVGECAGHLVQPVPYGGKSKWCEGSNRCAGGPPSVKYICLSGNMSCTRVIASGVPM